MPDSLLNTQFGPYYIQEEIGIGGMATVYKAFHQQRKALVALKVMHPHLARQPDILRRFRQETEIAGRLRHPHIVAVQEHGMIDELPYLAMDYLPGGSLAALFRRGTRISLRGAARLLQQIADALDYAHGQGIIHRDLKPANILMAGKGQVALSDFGIARVLDATQLTQTGHVPGTPYYMSPEQAQGQTDLDRRSDVYAFAIVAYLLVTGRLPFRGAHALAILHQQMTESPPRPSKVNPKLPQSLDRVLLKGLSRHPKDRYTSAGTFMQDFERALPHADPLDSHKTLIDLSGGDSDKLPVGDKSGRGLTIFTTSRSQLVRRRPAIITMAVVIVVTVLVGGLISLNGNETLTATGTQRANRPTVTAVPTNTPTSTFTVTPSNTPTPTPNFVQTGLAQTIAFNTAIAAALTETAALWTSTVTYTPTPTLTLTVTPTVSPTWTPSVRVTEIASCPGMLPSRIFPDGIGIVSDEDDRPVRMRDTPGLGGAVIDRLAVNTQFMVLEGPYCGPEHPWFRVEANGQTGWIAESGEGYYYVEPMTVPYSEPGDWAAGQMVILGSGGGEIWVRASPNANETSYERVLAGTYALITGSSASYDGAQWWREISVLNAANQITATGWVETFQITETVAPTTAPTAMMILFSSRRKDLNNSGGITSADNSSIYLMGTDSSGLRQLTGDEADDTNPVLSSDGRYIAFTRAASDGNDIYIMNSDGSNVRRLADGAEPFWSPDGNWIAFSCDSGNTNVCVVSVNGTDFQRLTNASASETNWLPRWSPDGVYVYFLSRRIDTTGDGLVVGCDSSLIMRVSANGGEQEIVYFADTSVANFNFSPDGQSIILAAVWEETPSADGRRCWWDDTSEVRLFDLNTGNMSVILAQHRFSRDPAFSPDSRSFIYITARGDVSGDGTITSIDSTVMTVSDLSSGTVLTFLTDSQYRVDDPTYVFPR